jgi:hypothetical protein
MSMKTTCGRSVSIKEPRNSVSSSKYVNIPLEISTNLKRYDTVAWRDADGVSRMKSDYLC